MLLLHYYCCSERNEDSLAKIEVIVTGGCGCLGREIVHQLLATSKYRVHCLDLFIPPVSKRISSVASYIQTDIANYSDISRALQGIEVVFHTAGLMPVTVLSTTKAMERVNTTGTRNVVKACKECGVKRLIHTSSCTVLMSKDRSLNILNMDESCPLPKDPMNAYVRTKGEVELAVREAHGDKLQTCALRLGGLIGGMDNVATQNMMSNDPVVLGKGWQVMSWTTVSSAAHVHLLVERYLAEGPASSNVFNVISTNSKYADIVSSFSLQNMGKPPKVIPVWLVKIMGLFNEGTFWLTGLIPLGPRVSLSSSEFITPFICSAKLAEEELGWVERRTLDEIVTDCLKQYHSQKL